MRYILSPSILAADFTQLGAQISQVSSAGAGWLHIDVMDGRFVPSISFGMPVIRSIRKCTDLFFDVHLMIEEPGRYIDAFAGCGANGITIHIEAAADAAADLGRIKELGLRAGIAISPDTDIERVRDVLPLADMLLVMTVRPGFGGQKYIEASTGRIMKARTMASELNPGMDIQVDGGITRDNVEMVMRAGANVIVMGSSVFKGDVAGNTAYFEKLFEKRSGE